MPVGVALLFHTRLSKAFPPEKTNNDGENDESECFHDDKPPAIL